MVRLVFTLLALAVVILVLVPFQWLGMALGWPMQRRIPHLFHRAF